MTTKTELNDLTNHLLRQLEQRVLDTVSLVDTVKQRLTMMVTINAVLVAITTRLIQIAAEEEDHEFSWNCCLQTLLVEIFDKARELEARMTEKIK